MSTESEAGGGGFWRGFFTGFFLLFVATIALIVVFPMAQKTEAPTMQSGAATQGGLETGGSGDAGSTAATDDGASLTPAAQPDVATAVQAPAASDSAVAPPQAPSASTADSTPIVVTAQDTAPLDSQPPAIAGAEAADPDVASGSPPSAISVVDAPQAPVGNTDGSAPAIAGARDQTPAEPVPAPVISDYAAVAQAPSVASGGSSLGTAPVPGESSAPAIAAAQDQTPAGKVPAPVSGDSDVVAMAPSVASGGGTIPSAPTVDAGSAAALPTVSDNGPASEQPASRIATQADGIGDHGVAVAAGSEIGAAARTFVEPPAQGGAPAEADAATTTVPGNDTDLKIAMAPVTEAPDTGDSAAVVDTSTADKPRQRPELPEITGPAFEAFAADFTDKKERPLLAIILLDVGDDGLSRDSLISIKLPVTYAISIDDPEAPWSEAAYREAGFEVLAMVPEGGAAAITRGQPGDMLATQLPAYFEAVPGAIGLLDRVDGEIQRDNNLVKALIAGLKPSGHALLMNKGSGFGSAVDLAKLENVPSISVSRVIDPDRSPSTIRANLDRAALQASKTGSAVVIGRTYPETVTTLVRWLLGGTARSVTVAPVSAAIRR